ncbi:MAG: hypothetical protein ACREYA_36480 [Cupriavidus necator]
MQIEDQKRKRVPFDAIDFSDTRNGVGGFAKGWYFLVSDAFKPALDIGYNEYIDDEKTDALRNKRSLELFGLSHEELKKQIEEAGEKLSDSEEHKRVMSFAIRYGRETQGQPPLYNFRQTDSLESKTGEWYVQVEQAVADTEEKQGKVGFRLYARNHNPKAGEGIWLPQEWLSTSQRDFVDLLRSGRCKVIDLANPQPMTTTIAEPKSALA